MLKRQKVGEGVQKMAWMGAVMAATTLLSLPALAQVPLSGAQQQTNPNAQTPKPPVGVTTTASPTPTPGTSTPDNAEAQAVSASSTQGIWALRGVKVNAIQFEGVTFGKNEGLISVLEQKQGEPLDPDKVRQSLRRLYSSGLYRNISLRGVRENGGVTLIFAGVPRYFVGRVTIVGVKSERLASILEYATQLQPGTAFQNAQVQAGTEGIRQTMEQNGYYRPTIRSSTHVDEKGDQVDVTYNVAIGPLARVGDITLQGKDPGFSPEEFRKRAKLKRKSKVSRDTVSNAFTKLRSRYQKNNRLEATVSLQKAEYSDARKQLDYTFDAEQGPIVKVMVVGDKLSKNEIKKLVPIYEESAVDNDLMNEGSHNIRDYLQAKGYFDVQVSVVRKNENSQETVEYTVHKGQSHKVQEVQISGNKYFETDLLRERMKVQKSDPYLRNGRFSPSLLNDDIDAIQALYRANGFDQTKISQDVKDVEDKSKKKAQVRVSLQIVEGPQSKFGAVALNGVPEGREKEMRALLNAQEGQPYSLITLSGDRDVVLGYYLSHGFDQARVEVLQKKNPNDPSKIDVGLNVTEGEQVFINQVLVSGIQHTRPGVVQKQLFVHANDPLDQSALLETQRNLYNLALFNEVNTAVQNPTGETTRKNVLVQLTESRRWDVTYGVGFEAQTGTPQTNCNAQASLNPGQSNNCTPEGKAGVSPRVSIDVTRINFRGKDQSLTLHGTYGLLEQIASLTFNAPHWFDFKKLDLSVSGGYSNVRNISTFAAKTLQGSLKVTHHIDRPDTAIYNFTYRRVQVDQSSLQITANLIPLLSQPVQVGGPGITLIRDTRQPSPLDATKGMYSSVEEFFSYHIFGSDTDFNKIDLTNSTYYNFGHKKQYTFARNTRLGFESVFGAIPSATCVGRTDTDPSCDPVPLPERLYAGGATSHRGFPINGAGPRDLTTGYPVGGRAAFVNSFEFRMPGPVLPIVNDNLQIVLFHDMGNVFQNIRDIWPSFGRFHQPNESTCSVVTGVTEGTCNFNYFSHAVGLGGRYKTPVGPIRVDFSYNLNPPVYPVINDYALPFPEADPHVGHGGHFGFFFSIGQSF